MYDGIQFRGRSQDALETLARHADVPVWNGLTDAMKERGLRSP
jgi:ornithine carbamoyltransferase